MVCLFFSSQGAFVIDRLSIVHISAVQCLTGATILSTFSMDVPESSFGKVQKIEHVVINDKRLVLYCLLYFLLSTIVMYSYSHFIVQSISWFIIILIFFSLCTVNSFLNEKKNTDTSLALSIINKKKIEQGLVWLKLFGFPIGSIQCY